ncbi:putative protein isoform X2 [Capsicum galapagoense]
MNPNSMHLNAIKNLKLEGISSTLYVIAHHHIHVPDAIFIHSVNKDEVKPNPKVVPNPTTKKLKDPPFSPPRYLSIIC